MNILVCAENDYIKPLSVMLYSLFANNSDVSDVFMIANESGELETVRATCDAFGVRLTLLNPSIKNIGEAPTKIHGVRTNSMYYRIGAGRLLPETVDKILYLDADLIVRKNLSELYASLPPESYLAAATLHASMKNAEFVKPFGGRYFNSGVMVLNVALWRRDDITGKCIAFIKDHPEQIRFHDQCVLNHVCKPWNEVCITWNYNKSISSRHAHLWGLTASKFDEIAADPAIIHYIDRKSVV